MSFGGHRSVLLFLYLHVRGQPLNNTREFSILVLCILYLVIILGAHRAHVRSDPALFSLSFSLVQAETQLMNRTLELLVLLLQASLLIGSQ